MPRHRVSNEGPFAVQTSPKLVASLYDLEVRDTLLSKRLSSSAGMNKRKNIKWRDTKLNPDLITAYASVSNDLSLASKRSEALASLLPVVR